MTEFPGVGHDLWNSVEVYRDATFRKWLFGQARGVLRVTHAPSCAGLRVHGVPAT